MKRKTPTERLIERIESLGFEVHTLSPVKGYWRKQDVLRWEARGLNKLNGYPCHFQSWDTVTKCARRGIIVKPEDRMFNYFDVHAKEKSAE